MQKIFISVAIAIVLCGGTSDAFDSDDIDIHAFGSTGYLKSDHNNYLVQSKEGSFEFNEAGLNVTTELAENARAGIQLFSRDLGNVGNNAVQLDWAFLDYHWKESLGIRLGKMKIPENLYNDTRDYDMLRSSILLPQSVYNEYYRETEASYQGAGLYGNFSLGSLGRLGYDAFVGTTSIDSDSALAKALSTFESTFAEANIDYLAGGRLKWHTPIEELMFGGAFMQLDMETLAETTSFPGYVDIQIPDMTRAYVFSEYNWRNLTLAAEYFRWDFDYTMQIDMSATGQESPPPSDETTESEGYYGLLSYRMTNWFELGAYYSLYYTDRDDRDGKHFEPDYRAWQKDIAISTRFDVTDFWIVKFEVHFMDGTALCAEVDNPDGFEQDWTFFAAKTTFYF